jgi:hypothetical protein
MELKHKMNVFTVAISNDDPLRDNMARRDWPERHLETFTSPTEDNCVGVRWCRVVKRSQGPSVRSGWRVCREPIAQPLSFRLANPEIQNKIFDKQGADQ